MFWLARFALCNVFISFSIVCMLAGGYFLLLPPCYLIIVFGLGDLVLGEQQGSPAAHLARYYNLLLLVSLPQLIATTLVLAWYVSPYDIAYIGLVMQTWFGFEPLKFSTGLSYFYIIPLVITVGFIFGMGGTNVAHELVHRTWSRGWVWVGRLLLTFTSDTSFEIEHVWGHHRHVATTRDPATSRRGENFYRFFVRSLLVGNLSAYVLEAERLKKKRRKFYSLDNQFFVGWFLTLSIYAFFFAVAGIPGLLLFGVCSLGGKTLLELINYIEHYGLVRQPDSKVEPRHSWNCNQKISLYHLYNLPRHSHHHAAGHIPFWRLKADTAAPLLPYGYLTMISIALVPPLFFRLMNPLVKKWDAEFAIEEELTLIVSANDAAASRDFHSYRLQDSEIIYEAS